MAADLATAPTADVLQVDLPPLGTAAVLGIPGAALAGEVVGLSALVGETETALLVERLACTPGWPARFALLQDWIARRVLDAPAPRADVAWAASEAVMPSVTSVQDGSPAAA